MRLLSDYWIAWLLLVVSYGCGVTSAIYFEKSDHKFIIAAFLQASAVFLALAVAYFIFESRSHQRQKRIDDGVGQSLKALGERAASAVITATGVVWSEPPGHGSRELEDRPKLYKEARELVLNRSRQISDYGYDGLHFFARHLVLQYFEDIAWNCDRVISLLGHELTEYPALIRSIVDFQDMVTDERKIWQIFRTSDKDLPPEAEYNLMVLAELTIRLIDVLNSENYAGDPNDEGEEGFVSDLFYRTINWNETISEGVIANRRLDKT